MSYSSLLYNKDNQTRISVLSGEPISDAGLLPPFRIYVYRFRSAREAEIFIAGIRLTGGNGIVCDWNPGSSDSNRTVMVGVLSEAVDTLATLHERVSLALVPSRDHDQKPDLKMTIARRRFVRGTHETGGTRDRKAAPGRSTRCSAWDALP
jgi:hypothetical protein